MNFGTLYVVATPIGNLEDITYRAVRILNQVDVVAAEDTRHTGKLLAFFQIRKELISCHEHNEDTRVPRLIQVLKQGRSIALVSDAGTPCISDPGYTIVKAAVQEGISVVPLPGACAAVTGLSVSGIATDSFHFSGFLPRKKGKREKVLAELKHQTATLIFYESPKRTITLLEQLLAVMGDRPAMVAREISKLHEEYVRGTLSEIIAALESKPSVKGECVVFCQGSDGCDITITEDELDKKIRHALETSGTKTAPLARTLSDQYRLSRKAVYDRILALKKRGSP
ncbi:MAG: 16S rRNA (cytidine(1402)-2'-O)-methyltransferase [Desulfobacteraceae bacterium]